MASEPRTIDLSGAKAEDFTILDENNLQFLYGGRYRSDDYLQVEGEDGKPKNMHKVTLEILCDHEQFLAFIKASAEKNQIMVKLV